MRNVARSRACDMTARARRLYLRATIARRYTEADEPWRRSETAWRYQRARVRRQALAQGAALDPTGAAGIHGRDHPRATVRACDARRCRVAARAARRQPL